MVAHSHASMRKAAERPHIYMLCTCACYAAAPDAKMHPDPDPDHDHDQCVALQATAARYDAAEEELKAIEGLKQEVMLRNAELRAQLQLPALNGFDRHVSTRPLRLRSGVWSGHRMCSQRLVGGAAALLRRMHRFARAIGCMHEAHAPLGSCRCVPCPEAPACATAPVHRASAHAVQSAAQLLAHTPRALLRVSVGKLLVTNAAMCAGGLHRGPPRPVAPVLPGGARGVRRQGGAPCGHARADQGCVADGGAAALLRHVRRQPWCCQCQFRLWCACWVSVVAAMPTRRLRQKSEASCQPAVDLCLPEPSCRSLQSAPTG